MMALGSASQHIKLVERDEERIKRVTGGNVLAALVHDSGQEDKISQKLNTRLLS